MNLKIGENIKTRREKCQIEQQALAERAGTSAAMLSYIERDYKKPSVELLVRIAEALKCTPNDLIYDQSA